MSISFSFNTCCSNTRKRRILVMVYRLRLAYESYVLHQRKNPVTKAKISTIKNVSLFVYGLHISNAHLYTMIVGVPILVLHCEFTAPELRACPRPRQDRGVHGRGPGSDRIHVQCLYAWCLDSRCNESSCSQRCRRIRPHPLPLCFLSCCLCGYEHGAVHRHRRQLRNLPGRSGDPFHCESHDTNNTSIALHHSDY